MGASSFWSELTRKRSEVLLSSDGPVQCPQLVSDQYRETLLGPEGMFSFSQLISH